MIPLQLNTECDTEFITNKRTESTTLAGTDTYFKNLKAKKASFMNTNGIFDGYQTTKNTQVTRETNFHDTSAICAEGIPNELQELQNQNHKMSQYDDQKANNGKNKTKPTKSRPKLSTIGRTKSTIVETEYDEMIIEEYSYNGPGIPKRTTLQKARSSNTQQDQKENLLVVKPPHPMINENVEKHKMMAAQIINPISTANMNYRKPSNITKIEDFTSAVTSEI